MTAQTTNSIDRVLRQQVLGSRRFSNYWWGTVVTLAGTGFLLSSVSSYLHKNLLPFADPTGLSFIPQGIAMGFYGVCGLLLGLYLWLTVLWNVGGGYNEFDRETGSIRIFRWGFPGKNRKIDFTCKTSDVQSVRVDIKEGISPRRSIYLKLKDRRQFPLTRVGQPLSLSEVENQAAELARFLQVPLEGL